MARIDIISMRRFAKTCFWLVYLDQGHSAKSVDSIIDFEERWFVKHQSILILWLLKPHLRKWNLKSSAVSLFRSLVSFLQSQFPLDFFRLYSIIVKQLTLLILLYT